MQMDPNEIFARNQSMNDQIHAILNRFSGSTQLRMIKTLRDHRANLDAARASNDVALLGQADEQARHTFREFLIGNYLLEAGFCSLEYSPELNGKTPDWLDKTRGILVEVFTNERSGGSLPLNRALSVLQKKLEKYAALASKSDFSFIVAIHGDFLGGIDIHERAEMLRGGKFFIDHPVLDGVVHFAETQNRICMWKQTYDFAYFSNPRSEHPLALPNLSIP